MKMGLRILFVEDDAIEAMKFRRVVSRFDLKFSITEAKDGEEALKILEVKDNLPDIVLLDLNMPKINGIEFLKILKKDEVLKYIPTIILTTSNNRRDILECYKIGIAGYVLKPLKYEEYMYKLKSVLDYWNINELSRI
ncbi:response regulator [Flavobacteriaceae bacterium R38]|nr:response regulator [Flavobacteriaceae bacterium R38]